MSKIVLTIEDDAETGAVKYHSECGDYTFKEGVPSPALIVAQAVLEFIQKAFEEKPVENTVTKE